MSKMLNGLAGDASTAVTRELNSGVGATCSDKKIVFHKPIRRSVAAAFGAGRAVVWRGDRSGSVIRLS